MPQISQIDIEDFNYPLPSERIAQFPLENRDNSKLLIYKDKKISEDIFFNINKYLPPKSLLVFNNTKVIHARLNFIKTSGAKIEIFCLEPAGDLNDMQLVFQQKGNCTWKCLIGNNKRWKSDAIKINNSGVFLTAEKMEQKGESFTIRFSWEPQELCFSEILEIFGKVPLPPYINRNPENSDNIRYQTVFAKYEGSVAAPTAGLHFTENILKKLNESGIQQQYLTLHVGAGTFKPVTAQNINEHEMHEEHFSVSKQFIEAIINQEQNPIIPVGTTSLRTLESLYWIGVKKILKIDNQNILHQWQAYEIEEKMISIKEAFTALLDFMNSSGSLQFNGSTMLIIVPGYKFKVAKGIITNFHQPKSTLLLLVSAMIGEIWKESYLYALDNDFRFLSYGDCCLFLPGS
ncbi:MAG: S-adenosylmethionine:tRNA ribosyltransferase-isomerase [Bacteroidetes bacterium]|nr:S-adenosylmethionine:tRNA ribosyltransferase-isomerase [Bacteroidota bacterium]